jgi:prepilin-type N-terminal cleavage/methylation domain-containing protein
MVLAESGVMPCTRTRQAGFSIVELLVVLAIAGVIAAMALPSATRTLADVRMHNDARAIHSLLSLAKMRAASKFTRVRLHCDFGNETFVLETFDKTTQTWITEENPQGLSANVDFDFNGLSDPPDDTQKAIGQAPACKADDGIADIANSGCIVFNSRGTPVDVNGNPDGNGAFYITDHDAGVYAVTVSATPLVRLWWSPAAVKAWVQK